MGASVTPPAACILCEPSVVPFYKDANFVYRSTELDALPWLTHGFGTRESNISAIFGNLATVKQIHSADCLAAKGRGGIIGEADALLENTPGAVIAVKTADCIPILLVDQRHRAVAAVHAGWRGTAAHIAQRAIHAMHGEFATEPADLHATIGPGIGNCCFEVGAEVAEHFGGSGRSHIDLSAHNGAQLVEGGVTPSRIYASNLCTKCLASEFHSFRRDREAAGRMFSFVGILPERPGAVE